MLRSQHSDSRTTNSQTASRRVTIAVVQRVLLCFDLITVTVRFCCCSRKQINHKWCLIWQGHTLRVSIIIIVVVDVGVVVVVAIVAWVYYCLCYVEPVVLCALCVCTLDTQDARIGRSVELVGWGGRVVESSVTCAGASSCETVAYDRNKVKNESTTQQATITASERRRWFNRMGVRFLFVCMRIFGGVIIDAHCEGMPRGRGHNIKMYLNLIMRNWPE